MKFSQRNGFKSVRSVLQIGSIDIPLRNRLWNVINEDLFNKLSPYPLSGRESERGQVFASIWKEFFGYMTDDLSRHSSGAVYIEGFTKFLKNW